MVVSRQIEAALAEEIEMLQHLALISAGKGFWYHSPSGYFVEISDDPEDWAHWLVEKTIIIPPSTHPEFCETVRHELTHLYDYQFLRKHKVLLFIHLILTQYWLFHGFYELSVNIRARSFVNTYSHRGNQIALGASCLWPFLFVYAFLVNGLENAAFLMGAILFTAYLSFIRNRGMEILRKS